MAHFLSIAAGAIRGQSWPEIGWSLGINRKYAWRLGQSKKPSANQGLLGEQYSSGGVVIGDGEVVERLDTGIDEGASIGLDSQ